MLLDLITPPPQVVRFGELITSLIAGDAARPAIAAAFRWFQSHGRPAGPAGAGPPAEEEGDGGIERLARRGDAELFEGTDPYAKRGEPG